MKQFNEINWEEIRNNFPASKNNTYFVSAAVGPISNKVYEAWNNSLKTLNTEGEINLSQTLNIRDDCRQLMADFIEAEFSDIGFSPNTSHNMNLLAMMLNQEEKRTIISASDEFPSTILPWYHHGFNVHKIKSVNGIIPIDEIINSINSETAAVVISMIQFSTGFKINVEKLGKILLERNIPFILNATQAIGAFPISVKEFHLSALSASCHKWLCSGYSGSVLYTNPDFRHKYKTPLIGWLSVEDPMLMSNDPQNINKDCLAIETGVVPFSALSGIKESIKVINEIGIENISKRILYLSKYLVNKLENLPIKFITPRDSEENIKETINSGIVVLEFENPQNIEEKLIEKNIYVSARRNGIRISTHYFNNEYDIDLLVNSLKELV